MITFELPLEYYEEEFYYSEELENLGIKVPDNEKRIEVRKTTFYIGDNELIRISPAAHNTKTILAVGTEEPFSVDLPYEKTKGIIDKAIEKLRYIT